MLTEGEKDEMAAPAPKDMSAIRPSGLDEDDSSNSSIVTDVFDRNSVGQTSHKAPGTGNEGLEDDGRRRFGSLESATSTNLSSVCSPIALVEKAESGGIGAAGSTNESRKRMSDGSLKPSLAPGPAAPSNPPPSIASQLPSTEAKPPIPAPKKRGRPPKDKSAIVPAAPPPRVRRASMISKMESEVRPRSSIPSRIPAAVLARQCVDAAHASRLNPFALHPGEHELLADLVTAKEVTVYLNIRNAILRLWVQNPRSSIAPEEAAGCAKDTRFFGLAEVAYKWLVRHGYINFGCVEVPRDVTTIARSRRNGKQKTVVVVGAGVSGLAAARQLEHLFAQDSAKWTDNAERPPKVIVLEGRTRVGGRVYSKPLRNQVGGSLPDGLRNTAEMGAMIVTGFERGNPLDAIIRGQLGLRYHLMKDTLTIYDRDGKAVNEDTDMLNTELYADITDRAGGFRAQPQAPHTLQGDEELITRCRDPVPDGSETLQLEPLFMPLDTHRKPASRRGRRRNAPPGTEKITGRSHFAERSNAVQSAARAAKAMGWPLKDGVSKNHSVSLHRLANASAQPTLGAVMDDAMEQYKDLIDLTSLDMRLLNWHHANLEYANAAPVSSLSLSGHDQDTGNEFEGAHSEVVGGYTQLPRGLMRLPTPLDVRLDRAVESIHYNAHAFDESEYSTKVVCTDGQIIEADEVILTVPLGVLKTTTIDFDPPLPPWKRGAVERMGFGLLNKVVLLYDEPFWDDHRDMFGLLNEAETPGSLRPEDYARKRGRFYLIWNASKISGRPMLVALMAGHAAHDAEHTGTCTLLAEITERFESVFPSRPIPPPLEVIVTRWKRDPFTRGTYSYVAPETEQGDYDLMAEPVGNLHFAGEATCGTHPATVHGAFLSGLRVAAEVMDSMVGPINLPIPLIASLKPKTTAAPSATAPAASSSMSRNTSWGASTLAATAGAPDVRSATTGESDHTPTTSGKLPGTLGQSFDTSFWARPPRNDLDMDLETTIIAAILSQIGERPVKPKREGVNPFLLFTKAKWDECKAQCAAAGPSSAGRDAIRGTIGKWWKAAPESDKAPYRAQSAAAQRTADVARREWDLQVAQWDEQAARIRRECSHARLASASDAAPGVSRRNTNVSNCVVLDHS